VKKELVRTSLRRLLLSEYLPLLLALLAFPSSVSAHRLDEYLQATLVSIEPGTIRLQFNLTPGVGVADKVIALIDRDDDGTISTNEATAYSALINRDLTLRLDQRSLELKLASSEFPTPTELRSGSGIIQLEFTATPGPLASGAHTVTLENHHFATTSVYLFNAAHPKYASVQIITQKRNDTQSTGEIQFAFHPPSHPSSGIIIVAAPFALLLVFPGAFRFARSRLRLGSRTH
jgi:hypothetical protein